VNSGVLATSTIAVSVALYGVLLWYMPQLTRGELYFAVTVPSSFRDTPDARSTLQQYRLQISVVTVILAVLTFMLGRLNPLLTQMTMYGETVASLVFFLHARRVTLPHAVEPTTVREASLNERPRIVPGGLPALAGPFAIMIAAAAYAWMHAGELPARIPVHFDMQWRPDGWADRTPVTLFAPLFVGFTTVLVIAISVYGLGHWVRAVYSGGALAAREVRYRRVIAAVLLASAYVVAVELAFITLLPFYLKLHLSAGFGLTIGFAPIVFATVVVVALVRFGPGPGSAPAALGSAPIGDRTPDRYWRLGIFYINPGDPAILVEKRFGLGYTFNFGHVVSWVLVIIPIALAALIPFVLHHSS
jgi:uncharacterized membrane protein